MCSKLTNNIEDAENHELRSKYVWNLLKNIDYKSPTNSVNEIPKTIIQYWNDSNEVPTDVLECMKSWKKLEKLEFKQLLFNDITAKEFITENYPKSYLEAFNLCNHPAMRADYFRLCYLLKNGGFYVDADDVYNGTNIEILFKDCKLKVQPLCYSKSKNSMIEMKDFLFSSNYSDENIYYINNDPIITPKNHPIIEFSLKRATKSLLANSINKNDIQSLTGPGNLTASIVHCVIEFKKKEEDLHFDFIKNWDEISFPKWPLEYRSDKRNWRIWDGNNM